MSLALEKSPEAFRTISEAAELVGVPTHVLRFWESRFPQVKPVKRAGGRRYYRPADVDMLLLIRKMLHEDGMTIRGARKLLRDGSSTVPDVTVIQAPAPPPATVDEAPMAVDVEPEPEPQPRVLSFSRKPPELLPEPEAEAEAEPPLAAKPKRPASTHARRLRSDADWSKVGQLVERLEALSERLKGQG